jgi:hypothetical protein
MDTTTRPEDDLAIDSVAAVEEAKGLSLLRAAEKRRESSGQTLFLDIPSWGGDLIAEYKVLERTRVETLIRKIQSASRDGSGNSAAARTAADIDLLIEANVGIYAYDAEAEAEADGDPAAGRVPIKDDTGIVTFGRIGPVLGQDFKSVREAVLYLMKNNGVAITAHAVVVARWMRDPSKTASDLEAEA